MRNLQQKIKLPFIISLGSFILIFALAATTNPLYSIIYAILFFILVFIFLANTTLLLLKIQGGGKLERSTVNRVLLIISGVVLILMLRSAKALNLIDIALMLIFFSGLIFYFNRR